MNETTLADRLNKVISDLGVQKSEFARSIGISRNHIYQLTNGRLKSCSRSVAMLIEQKYNYRAEWVLTGKPPAMNLASELAEKMKGLDDNALRSLAAQIDKLKGGGDK